MAGRSLQFKVEPETGADLLCLPLKLTQSRLIELTSEVGYR